MVFLFLLFFNQQKICQENTAALTTAEIILIKKPLAPVVIRSTGYKKIFIQRKNGFAVSSDLAKYCV
jgi:hypothetical protein